MVSLSIFKRGDKNKKEEENYLEVIPAEQTNEVKVWVRVFSLKDTSEVKSVVDTLREGNTIVFVDIRKLKESKDIVELKRAINKIKSVVDAINGDIIGVGNEWIIATPSFAKIYRGYKSEKVENINSNNQ